MRPAGKPEAGAFGFSCRDCSATAGFWCEYNCGVLKRKRSDRSSPDSQAGGEPAPQEPQVQRWKPVTRIAFRFCFAYLGLFSLATQISGSMIPNLSFYYRGLGRL